MENKHKFSIVFVLTAVWGVLLVHTYSESIIAERTIAYNEFMNALKQSSFTEIPITQGMIHGKIKNKQWTVEEFKTVRVDSEFSRTQEHYDVTFKGQVESILVHYLMAWAFPALVFLGI
jgi:cell division protease FtsH